MLLPIPTPDEVIRFQALYKEQYDMDLPAREALSLLTRLTQFYYLTGGHEARRQRLQQQEPAASVIFSTQLVRKRHHRQKHG